MTTYSQLSTTESKKQKQTTQTEQEQNHRYGIIWRVVSWEKEGNAAGIKTHHWSEQYRQGAVKNSIGKREAKELTPMTHGHELRAGMTSGGEG